ncbi:hypothetical protein [Bradyrhizobium sp. Cp5.3]|uniref:hypothetical protein n=1 Tax=Bradyrhizobium sp. Cp5.3 TaxID=443598 RepID=UPI0003FFD332|nr:hypothetical protein [Bradyrhizobium sp. Cp5.3]
MKENFLKHFPESAKEHREIVETAFAILTNAQQKAADIRSDKRLSDFGRSERLAELMKGGPGEHLAQLKSRSQVVHAGIESRKKNLRLPEIDREDRYDQEARRQIVDYVRSLPLGERLRAATATPEAMRAILNAPMPIMTGLSDHQIEQVRESAEQAAFGPQHKQFAIEERHAAVIEDAITFVEGLISKETGIVHDNTPEVITRDQLAAADPAQAAEWMRAVSDGKAKLVDA